MSTILMDNISQYSTGSESRSNSNPFENIENTIKLKLKKPCTWNWELSTSKSSPSIAFPRILLYDDKGSLLAETQESENIFNSCDPKEEDQTKSNLINALNNQFSKTPLNYSDDNSNNLSRLKRYSDKSSSSASSTSIKTKNQQHSRRSSIANIQELNENLSGFVECLESEGFNCNLNLQTADENTSSNSGNSVRVRRKGSLNNLFVNGGGRSSNRSLKNKTNDINREKNVNIFLNSHELNNNDANNRILCKSQSVYNISPNNKLEELSNNSHNSNSNHNNHNNRNNIGKINDKVISIQGDSNYDQIGGSGNNKNLLQRDVNVEELRPIRKRYVKSKSVNLETLVEEGRPKNDFEQSAKVAQRKTEKSLTPLKEVRFDLKKSKSTTDILLSQKERKKCLRTNSNSTVPSKFSKSILERMSASKTGSSSESQDIDPLEENKPRYFLRTSNAGTLVVCEESFRGRKLRRRPRSVPKNIENVNDLNQNDRKDCSSKFYDNEITKLNNLISKVSSISKTSSIRGGTLNKAENSNNNEKHVDGSRGKSVDNAIWKAQERTNLKKKTIDIRRCISAGNVWISSDDDENNGQQKKEVKLRRKRKIHPIKPAKGDQILTFNNNTNLITSLQSTVSSPTHIINEKPSDELLLRFVQSFASLKQNHNHQEEKNDFIIEKDSILRENDDYIDFQVIKNLECLNSKPLINDSNYDTTNYSVIENHSSIEQNSTGEEDLITICENKNMGSNVSRSSSKQSELAAQHHHPRRRTHSSGDIHGGNKYNNNCGNNLSSSIFHNLSSTNPNDKLNTIPGYHNQSLPLNGTGYKSSNNKNCHAADTIVDETINHLITTRDRDTATKYKQNNLKFKQSGVISSATDPEQHYKNNQQHNDERIPLITTTDCGVTRQDRNKFRGSLPNHLDCDTFVNDDDLVENSVQNYSTNFKTSNSSQPNSGLSTDLVEYVTVTPNWQQQQQYQTQPNNSPYHASDKETASTSSANTSNIFGNGSGNGSGSGSDVNNSTFKINQDKTDIQLTLPLVRTNFDPSCDQGYGSERSPEDELPPSTLSSLENTDNVQQHLNINWNNPNHYITHYEYNFITEDCTFSVQIVKGPRGLGLSISGGIDTNTAFPGLIRIKRLFPHQAAWLTGKLLQGDIILEANGIPLTGLTNYEALEVLRTMPNDVILLICRPVDEQYTKLSPPTEPPKPPQRTQQQSIHTQTLPEELSVLYLVDASSDSAGETNSSGEFEIFMVKQQGSLGFTLSKEDESILGHYVRALVREPATTDGRIKPGDKIVAVNDVPLSPMTHAQAVIFLRQSADVVKLRLYRDEAQTPIEPASPTMCENKGHFGLGKKVILRPEALNLLTDLAHKKQHSQGDSTESSNISTASSPRRLKRGHKSQSPQNNKNSPSLSSNKTPTLASDSDQSMDSQCSYLLQPIEKTETELSFNSRTNRPTFLELGANNDETGKTSSGTRKPNYQFLAGNKNYGLNNLDNDELDAPFYNGCAAVQDNNDRSRFGNNLPLEINEFASLPCEALIGTAAKLSSSKCHNDAADVCHKNPLYQSVHLQQNQQKNTTDELASSSCNSTAPKYGHESLLKWKGVVLTADNDNETEQESAQMDNNSWSANSDDQSSELNTPHQNGLGDLKGFPSDIAEGYTFVSVELNRGWNSRLGFSLQPVSEQSPRSIISAIYSDSVAARDGRLRAGDILFSVNDEPVETMSTSEIIDFLRIIRGAILITVLRKQDP